jgi:hypothetical protein
LSASSFTSSSRASFGDKVGWVYSNPHFAHEVIRDASGRKNPCHLLTSSEHDDDPVAVDALAHQLSHSLPEELDWKETPETKGERNIQRDHLEPLAKCLPWISTKPKCLKKFGLTEGVVTGGSRPDAIFLDTNRVPRGIMEVKGSAIAEIEGLRQAAASAINVACFQVDRGVPPLDVIVPIVSSNGHRIQFGAVLVLPPCFPYFLPLTGGLDLGNPSERSEIAKMFLRIKKLLGVPLPLPPEEIPLKVPREMSKDRYLLQPVDTIFCSQPNVTQSLRHIFEALKKAFDEPKCRDFVVFPICFSGENQRAIVFLNLVAAGYRQGVPCDNGLRNEYFESLDAAVREIHNVGLVHLNLTPSNILWKKNEGDDGISIKISGWEFVQLLGKPYSEAIGKSLGVEGDVASTDRDLLHLKRIRDDHSGSSFSDVEDKSAQCRDDSFERVTRSLFRQSYENE